jgi:CheY-like chemotaxis protein
MPTTELNHPSRTLAHAAPRYLLRLTLPQADWDDAWEVCRGIERCGGHRSNFGFAFCSASERAEALEILREQFGAEYFECLDVHSEAEAVRILLALPDEDRRHEYGAGLARHGFRVAEAASGVECLEVMRQQQPDIVVLEEGLLWGGAEGVLTVMRQDRAWAEIPVVFLQTGSRGNQSPAYPPVPFVRLLEAPGTLPLLEATIEDLMHQAV